MGLKVQEDGDNNNDNDDERKKVIEYLRKEVEDWDDEEKAKARFKGMSGQSSDYEWQARYNFWKQLIINIARHLNVLIIRPQQLKSVWFRRHGHLSPLCLDHVLVEMLKNGELLRFDDAVHPKTGHLSEIFRKVLGFVRPSPAFDPQNLSDDYLVISALMKERSLEVVKHLSESHWTPSCVITMNKFQEICGGVNEASTVLSHLAESGKAKHLSIQRKDLIEGVKVVLTPGAGCSITSLDYDVLHLVWTVERLEQQLDVIDCRHEKFKSLALASLKSGDRTVALRHARELKRGSQGREKCATLLNQVEEVLRVIADAESSKKVSEAIIIGARAIKEHNISAEEVEQSLSELNDSIASKKQVDQLLESSPSYSRTEDEEIEDELRQLELDMGMEPIQSHGGKLGVDSSVDASEITDSLSNALSDTTLSEGSASESTKDENTRSSSSTISKNTRSKVPKVPESCCVDI